LPLQRPDHWHLIEIQLLNFYYDNVL
jgi:hypothetical protein